MQTKQFKIPFELTKKEMNEIEQIFLRVWKERSAGTPAVKVWWETFAIFLHANEMQPPSRGDRLTD